MILLGMEDEINRSIKEELAENLKKENDEEQEIVDIKQYKIRYYHTTRISEIQILFVKRLHK